jgi:ubiquinone/menaquinone biosynthesis C-methylase UbiE
MSVSNHNRSIIDQFTRQAAPFSRSPAHNSAEAMEQILRIASPTPTDRALDVACGPGIIACLIAPHVAHMTGADLTAAMLVEAEKRRIAQNIPPIAWIEGDAEHLPFDDGAFDLVVTRYSFHHLVSPEKVLREMARVCRAGGRIVIADVVMPAEKVSAFDTMERLRDPSHTRTLTPEKLDALIVEAGLIAEDYATHAVSMTLEYQLAKSFPNPGDDERIREIFRDEPEHDRLGLSARREGDDIVIHYPTGVLRVRKPAKN